MVVSIFHKTQILYEESSSSNVLVDWFAYSICFVCLLLVFTKYFFKVKIMALELQDIQISCKLHHFKQTGCSLQTGCSFNNI